VLVYGNCLFQLVLAYAQGPRILPPAPQFTAGVRMQMQIFKPCGSFCANRL